MCLFVVAIASTHSTEQHTINKIKGEENDKV